jgi:hypothetical protein
MDRPKRYLSDEREAAFPKLRKNAYEVTSDADWAYNCVAHAAGKNDLPWWPAAEDAEGIFWPSGVDRAETVDAFVAAFRTVGYRPCEGSEDGPGFIVGFEKVVIYVDTEGVPSHTAKQTQGGRWTSKLGEWEDIEHDFLENLAAGPDGRRGYGKPVKYLIREIRDQ